ncbi:hypothetical protein LBMAG56_39290 [Verrucomicrobiota bacterium]|nr:hypothetical protein LBMAG56_39290 [Verrucomicrobiota bacterium]
MNPTLPPTPSAGQSGTSRCLPAFLSLLTLFALLATGPRAQAQVAGPITVYPENSSLEIGGNRQFSAYVPISPNTVVWSVNDIIGGNATYGTITTNGNYLPPAVPPSNNVVSIKARSTAYPTSVGTAQLTITRPYPWLWSVSPSPLVIGNYEVSFNGANFTTDSQALCNGVAVTSIYVSATKLIARGGTSQPGTNQFSVRQPGPGAVVGNVIAAPVTAVPTTVAISPTATSVSLGTTRTFVSTVTGNTNTAVTWSVNGIIGGSATVGTISATGAYTAPPTLPSPATVTIRATSVAVSTAYAQATVTLVPPPVTVTVSPARATVEIGTTRTFAATVVNNTNTSVTWSVNGVNGGSATVGTISAAGVYVAPSVLPASTTVIVRATSVANPSAYGQATVTLTPPSVVVAVSPSTATVQVGSSRTFTATVTGNTNTAVTWSVNGTTGGSATVGTISAAGVYSAPAALPTVTSVTIRASSVVNAAAFGQATVTLASVPPPVVWLPGARFLEQASFGPTPATLAAVQQKGIPAYLQEQFALPATVIPTPTNNSMGELRNWVLYNYTSAPDQLRQRVIYSLSQIVVTSANKLIYPDMMLPWMRILSQHAFGNYRDLLRDVTMSPSMGKYLDLAYSTKPGPGGGANENYARELMQLFTIGLWQLNADGSLLLDGYGLPMTTYDQRTVAQMALALTGWVYATPPGGGSSWEYAGAPMVPQEARHDTTAKSILGRNLPANQTVQQDLESVLDCLMSHPNIAPFIATRLIRSLVTSNPSGAYIQRVASVFANNGNGVAGDLKAVVTAILLDPEARQDTPVATQGRLKEPILQVSGFLRALNGGFSSTQQLTYLFDYMAQSVLNPPSVFSWFSPLYRVPHSSLFGPEFQIYSPTEATLRGNLLFGMLNYSGGDTVIDLSPFQPYGNDMPNLVEAVNQVLLYGRMPAAIKQVLIDAATPGYDARSRIETVLYLTALSGLYAVQY